MNEIPELHKINLDRLVWFPLVILVVTTLLLMSGLVYRQVIESEEELKININSRLESDKNSIDAEVYLGQSEALQMRLSSIISYIEDINSYANACFSITYIAHDDKSILEKKVEACTSKSNAGDWSQKDFVNIRNIKFGGNEIGQIKYYAYVPLSISQILPMNLLISMFVSILIALFSQKLLIKMLHREVIEPYLSAVKLGERLKAKADIASQVAHDIRSPLTALDFAVKGLREIPQDYRDLIQSAINRINGIANDLLQKNKIKQSSEVTESKPLLKIINDIINEKRLEYKISDNIALELDAIVSEDLHINIEASAFSRVLSNLLNNALESINKVRGTITIQIRQSDEFIFIKVTDNGCGIPKSVLPEVGNAGFSYGKSVKQSGSGLGLSFAKQIINSCGGTLSIESELNVGTAITITLPSKVINKRVD